MILLCNNIKRSWNKHALLKVSKSLYYQNNTVLACSLSMWRMRVEIKKNLGCSNRRSTCSGNGLRARSVAHYFTSLLLSPLLKIPNRHIIGVLTTLPYYSKLLLHVRIHWYFSLLIANSGSKMIFFHRTRS